MSAHWLLQSDAKAIEVIVLGSTLQELHLLEYLGGWQVPSSQLNSSLW